MITPAYCVTMARYNQWQNKSLRDHFDAMSDDELRADRGLFFGSILKTLDHIMWADRLWLNRLDPSFDVPAFPDGDAQISSAHWSRDRETLDARIIDWANGLSPDDLLGDVIWESKIYAKTFTHNRALAVTHMFNHQTHHRGQIHGALTVMGRNTMDTDLVFMPEI